MSWLKINKIVSLLSGCSQHNETPTYPQPFDQIVCVHIYTSQWAAEQLQYIRIVWNEVMASKLHTKSRAEKSEN